jgi:hypothetical protein
VNQARQSFEKPRLVEGTGYGGVVVEGTGYGGVVVEGTGYGGV